METRVSKNPDNRLESQRTLGEVVDGRGRDLFGRLAIVNGVDKERVGNFLEEISALPFPLNLRNLQEIYDKYGYKKGFASLPQPRFLQIRSITIYGPKGGTRPFPGLIHKEI